MEGALVDTHSVIWMVSDEAKLGGRAREVLFDPAIKKYISPATYWEIAIKIKTGKLQLTTGYDDFLAEVMDEYGLEILHIQPHHTSFLTTLDLFHKDPFDRLLIAQASTEGMPIISIDDKFDAYPVQRWWHFELDIEDDYFGEDEEVNVYVHLTGEEE